MCQNSSGRNFHAKDSRSVVNIYCEDWKNVPRWMRQLRAGVVWVAFQAGPVAGSAPPA